MQSSIKRVLKASALVVGSALLLAACDGDGGDDDDDAEGIASLGGSFVAAFNADPNDTPVDAQDVDLTLTPLAQPFNP